MIVWCRSLYTEENKLEKLWGNKLHDNLSKRKFTQCTGDSRHYFYGHTTDLIIVRGVVGSITFSPTNTELIKNFYKNLVVSFEVNFYRKINSFFRRTITHSEQTILFSQTITHELLLGRFGMQNCYPVGTSVPSKAYLFPQYAHKVPLNAIAHHNSKTMINGISCLAH